MVSMWKGIKKKNDKIIIFIVTSYSEYLDDAMRFHVFRYLSKPLAKQRFFRNMKDAVDLYNTMTVKIPVETKQGVHTLPASSVIAVEAQGRKVTVHTTLCDFESIHNMQYWLELLLKTVSSRHTAVSLSILNMSRILTVILSICRIISLLI